MATGGFAAALPFMDVDPDTGEATITGHRCNRCEVVLVGRRAACSACYARGSLQPLVLRTTGRLQNYTIVHRSYPGVKTPFVAAVVDLDGGGVLKGTLRDMDPTAAHLEPGAAISVLFDDTGQRDRQGRVLISYYFKGVGA
jgi:uncharacterized OB-fold protein